MLKVVKIPEYLRMLSFKVHYTILNDVISLLSTHSTVMARNQILSHPHCASHFLVVNAYALQVAFL